MQANTKLHVYEVRLRKDKRAVNLISDVLPFGRLWYGEPNAISNAVGYAQFYSRSHDAVIRVYDEAGKVIKTHDHQGTESSAPLRFWSEGSHGLFQIHRLARLLFRDLICSSK